MRTEHDIFELLYARMYDENISTMNIEGIRINKDLLGVVWFKPTGTLDQDGDAGYYRDSLEIPLEIGELVYDKNCYGYYDYSRLIGEPYTRLLNGYDAYIKTRQRTSKIDNITNI